MCLRLIALVNAFTGCIGITTCSWRCLIKFTKGRTYFTYKRHSLTGLQMYAAILELCNSKLGLEKQLAAKKDMARQQERRHKEELQRRDDLLFNEEQRHEMFKVESNSRIRGLKAKFDKEAVARDALEAKLAKFESELQQSRTQAIQYKKKVCFTCIITSALSRIFSSITPPKKN